GAQCYHNYQYCGNGKIGGNDAVITHDLSPESLFNFTVSYNPPIPSNPPPSNPPLSNPPPSSGGGGGSSSPPPSSGGGGEGSTLPSGGSSSSGGSSGSRSSGGNSSSTAIPGVTGGSPSTNSSTPDSSPPTTPTNFNATEDPDNKVVDLNWDASTDDTAVKGYRLERQANDGTWQTLSDTITGTSYQDDSATFGSANNYRLQAFDDSGNVSDYATASVTTDTFEANALQNSDAFINSKDNTVTVTI